MENKTKIKMEKIYVRKSQKKPLVQQSIELKTLLVASIKTLKRPKIICLIDEIIKLV